MHHDWYFDSSEIALVTGNVGTTGPHASGGLEDSRAIGEIGVLKENDEKLDDEEDSILEYLEQTSDDIEEQMWRERG